MSSPEMTVAPVVVTADTDSTLFRSLEQGVGHVEPERCEVKRNGAGDRKRDPQQIDDKKAQTSGKRCVDAAIGGGCSEADCSDHKGRDGKNLPVGVAEIEIDNRGRQHGHRDIEAGD